MIAFEIHLNGEKLCLASVGEYGVLSQTLSWVERKRDDQQTERKTPQPHLHIGGLVDDEHVYWIKSRNVNVGDEITLKILDVQSADEPVHRETAETDTERAAKVDEGLNATKALLPSSPIEGDFLSSLRGYEALRAADEPEMAVKTLAKLGDLNGCAPEFWAELQSVAGDLQMYRQLDGYRKKAKLDDETEAD